LFGIDCLVPPSTDGTATLVNREIGRALFANYRKVPFSGAVEHLNEAATARYFGDLSGESPETRTAWRSELDSNSRCRWFSAKQRILAAFCSSPEERMATEASNPTVKNAAMNYFATNREMQTLAGGGNSNPRYHLLLEVA
jgi:hypothetical protein